MRTDWISPTLCLNFILFCEGDSNTEMRHGVRCRRKTRGAAFLLGMAASSSATPISLPPKVLHRSEGTQKTQGTQQTTHIVRRVVQSVCSRVRDILYLFFPYNFPAQSIADEEYIHAEQHIDEIEYIDEDEYIDDGGSTAWCTMT